MKNIIIISIIWVNIITAEIWSVIFFFHKVDDCIYASHPTSSWGYQLLTAFSGVWLLLTLISFPIFIMYYLDKKDTDK